MCCSHETRIDDGLPRGSPAAGEPQDGSAGQGAMQYDCNRTLMGGKNPVSQSVLPSRANLRSGCTNTLRKALLDLGESSIMYKCSLRFKLQFSDFLREGRWRS